MKLNRLTEGPSTDGRFRKLLMAALATAISTTACNGEDPNNNGAGGQAAEGGGGSGGTGGANPCEGLQFEGLADGLVNPGETKTVTVNLGDSHPDKAYNELGLQVNGDILNESGLVGLVAQTDVNVNDGYELVDMKGFRTLVIDPEQHYRLNADGNCELNTMTVNADAMNDADKQPVVTLPPGLWLSTFRMQEGGEGILEDFELTANGTRAKLSELNGPGHFPANSKPEVIYTVTRDQDDHAVLDLTGTTDESDGSETTLEALGVSSTGVTLEPVPGETGKFRSTAPFLGAFFPLSVSGRMQSLLDDTTETQVDIADKPEIANLAIDCSSTGGSCGSGGLNYPIIFNVTDATDCIITLSLIAGAGPPGTNGPVIINGTDAFSMHTTGPWAGDIIQAKTDCYGPGGFAVPATIQFNLD